jgi:hypothetical protein
MKPFCIVDLDNCVFDDRWRHPMIDLTQPVVNDRYVRYHDNCHLDIPGDTIEYVLELTRQYKFLIFTSRPESVRSKTLRSLQKFGIPYVIVWMRPDDCHLNSVDIKREMLADARRLQYDIQFAIDDRQDILDMYLAEGVPAVRRVAIHEIPLHHVEVVNGSTD